MLARLEGDACVRIAQRWLPCEFSPRMPREVKLLEGFTRSDEQRRYTVRVHRTGHEAMRGYHCARESPIEYRSVPTGPPTPFIPFQITTEPATNKSSPASSPATPQQLTATTLRPLYTRAVARFSTVTSPSPTLS